jgi:hypothetical protein
MFSSFHRETEYAIPLGSYKNGAFLAISGMSEIRDKLTTGESVVECNGACARFPENKDKESNPFTYL